MEITQLKLSLVFKPENKEIGLSRAENPLQDFDVSVSSQSVQEEDDASKDSKELKNLLNTNRIPMIVKYLLFWIFSLNLIIISLKSNFC